MNPLQHDLELPGPAHSVIPSRTQVVNREKPPTSPAASRTLSRQACLTDECCLHHWDELQQLLEQSQAHSLFLVTDKTGYEYSGARSTLAPLISDYRVTIFDQFEPNPKYEDVQTGLKAFRESGAEIVIAIGGGTAIDIAKLIAAVANEKQELLAFVHQQATFTSPPPMLIAIPTTAGTGSEATQFAVVYVEGMKYSVDHPHLLPAYCLLAAELTQKLPEKITANTGLDAFCQAIESLWSVRSDETSSKDAIAAIQLAWTYLPAAVQNPDQASRAAMMRAAHLAGRAINRTRTTASHAISYPLTSDYGIPHGHAVAVTLGAMLEFNAAVTTADLNDSRGVAHVQSVIRQIFDLLGCETAEQGREAIENFVQSLGCETRLTSLGVAGTAALETIASQVNLERLGNNPRKFTHEQLLALLKSLG